MIKIQPQQLSSKNLPRTLVLVLQQGRGEKYLTEAFVDSLHLSENFVAKDFEYDMITIIGVLEGERSQSFSFFFKLTFFAYTYHIRHTKIINMLL